MRLQRLEISGFKSFSDRAELAFDLGVTAIVGPNGCGKSNVADALTWVLGEQSAKSLRGERMEDVIFSGSDARKPNGSAEVRLRLAGVTTLPADGAQSQLTNGNGHVTPNGNGNGHANGHAHLPEFGGTSAGREVEVTRRLYRSGESEYLIDGHPCRLRDVHELLMDTGLGAKAYAIIEQGKIGMILSSRPADRRQLIEEAAGITKYKARRRAAELKLEAALQNLTRVDDIVFEVEKQRGTLKRQAAKARRYKRLRDELRRWEKVLFARRYRELGAVIESARTRLADARTREAAAAARVAELETTVGRLRIELAEADARATAAREEAHLRELEAERCQKQVDLDRQQLAATVARIAEMDTEAAGLDARREPARLQIDERRQAALEAHARRSEAEAAFVAEQEALAEASRQLEAAEAEVDEARNAAFQAASTLTTLRHAIQHAAASRERVTETLGRLEIEEADVRVEGERLLASQTTAADALRDAHRALDAARAARDAAESARTAAAAQQQDLARALRDREHEVARLTARLHSLEELQAARAGYGDAARVVLKEANGSVGQLGAVADYLEVERGYERAVEAVLGELLQHVIVQTHDHARAGIQLVREAGAGRCGFVVLDGVAYGAPDAVPAPDGVRGLDELVRPTGPYAAAIARALGTAWVAHDFHTAVAAAGQARVRVGTVDGEVLAGPHLVSGGAAAESRGILATKAEIGELRERVETGQAAVHDLNGRVSAAAAALGAAQSQIEASSADVHRHEKAIVALEAQLARVAEDQQRLQRKTELLALDRRRAEEEARRLDERQTDARESSVRAEQQHEQAAGRLAEAQGRLQQARELAGSIGQRVAEARALHAGLVERALAVAAEVQRLQDAARELDARVASLHAERTQKDEARRRLEAAIAEGLRGFDDQVRALTELRAQVTQAEEAAAECRGRDEAEEGHLREARAVLDVLRAQSGELDISRATAESDLAHLSAACHDAVQASLDEVLVEVEQLEREGGAVPDERALAAADAEGDDESAGQTDAADTLTGTAEEPADSASAAVAAAASRVLTAEDAIARLRSTIDRLGPVNMMAIEQFEELETRHTFLTTQRKDLSDSIAATNEAIKRIDETSKTRFRDAFVAINQNFQKTFATLFGGGRAGIALLDESDPLESGIDIVASPPGKRLQSVQLLSGGEKALTAIALMFAIFQYKPSPFCLLDEIDAPLDDANIGRFVEMLKGMLHHTQFILITHNRKTMEIADRLYGVTMEEPGVSKLISVRLN